jgi:hypothetical protein
MSDKRGYDFNRLPDYDIQIGLVKCSSTELNRVLNTDQIDSRLHDRFREWQQWDGCLWSFIWIDEDRKIAEAMSSKFSTEAIYFFCSDNSGELGYELFDNGDLVEEYISGPDYSEDFEQPERREGTIVASRKACQFVFWSRDRKKTGNEIIDENRFIDEFLRSKDAYIGYELEWGMDLQVFAEDAE